MVPEALHTPRVGTGQGMALGAQASMVQHCVPTGIPMLYSSPVLLFSLISQSLPWRGVVTK